MAKQTFTTGSVLTATQMNNLQANDYNWTVSQKTASYVLVAADAGTRIEMNAAGSTTITVNTGLFTAGDTLFIQNIGAGTCTITAGTATVNKATGINLALSQYQGGYLYFVSASSAIFFGSPPAGGSMTLLSTTALSGTSINISSIDQTYTHLQLYVSDYYTDASTGPFIRVNSNTTSPNYTYPQVYIDSAGSVAVSGSYGTQVVPSPVAGANADNNNVMVVNFYFYTSSLRKVGDYTNLIVAASGANPQLVSFGAFGINETSAISQITLRANGNMSGSALLYGVK